MNKYQVTFTQYHVYNIEATNENEAERFAYKEFENEMRNPVANIFYDEVEVEETEREGDEEGGFDESD